MIISYLMCACVCVYVYVCALIAMALNHIEEAKLLVLIETNTCFRKSVSIRMRLPLSVWKEIWMMK